MKRILQFLLYTILFFIIIFGFYYGMEAWVAHRGKTLNMMLIESCATAVVFAVFLILVLKRSEEKQQTDQQKEHEKIKRNQSRWKDKE